MRGGGRWRKEEDGMERRFMEGGGIYYHTALPQGGEGRGVGTERENIPFPLPLLCLYRSHTGGWRSLFLCLKELSLQGRCYTAEKSSRNGSR